jgi:hypothetical protein
MFSQLAFGYYLRGVAKARLGDRAGAAADFRAVLEGEALWPFVQDAERRLVQS